MSAVVIIVSIGIILIFGSILFIALFIGNLSPKERQEMGVDLNNAHDRKNHYRV